MSQDSHHTFPPRLIGLLVVLTITWGFNWPMMKPAISGMAPMHFRTLCLLVGAAGLFTMAAAGRIEWRVPRAEWGRLALIAFFNLTGWNILAIYGVSMMDSGRASILPTCCWRRRGLWRLVSRSPRGGTGDERAADPARRAWLVATGSCGATRCVAANDQFARTRAI